MFRLFSNLYSDDDTTGTGRIEEDHSVEGIFDELSKDIDKENEKEEPLELKPAKSEKKTEEDTEGKDGDKEVSEEDEELKAIEEELEEPDEEKLELMTPVRRREILKKYPELFKDFPYLEKAYYREQQFTEVFPTIDEAKVASQKAEVLDAFEQEVMDGNLETVMRSVRDEDQAAFHKLVDNYLPSLMKVDSQAYYHVLGNVVKDTIITMVREAQSMGEENGAPLKSAAAILNQFVFGTSKFTAPEKLAKGVDKEEETKQKEERERQVQEVETKFTESRDSLQTKCDNVIKSTIEQNIDPRKSMTDYVRKNAVREAFEQTEELITKDSRFRNLLDKLWERAFQEGFSERSLSSIRSAYLSKAKTLLPTTIKKARNDALRGLGKRTDDGEERETTDRKGPITAGRSASSANSGKVRSAKDIPKGMKTLDFLNSD